MGRQDLWHVYNLVRAGDLVRCTTVRKVQRESASGATDSEKIKLTLEVEMEGEVLRWCCSAVCHAAAAAAGGI